MDIQKTAIDWAKAEVFSAQFFILGGILFVFLGIGFWQLGKTEVAKAYIFPSLIAGILLLIVGIGIFFGNKARVTSFSKAFEKNPTEFVESEITRTKKSMSEYKNIVFKIIPLIIVICALCIIFFDKPLWRAICITTIGMMFVILLVDSNANARIEDYHEQLLLVKKSLGLGP